MPVSKDPEVFKILVSVVGGFVAVLNSLSLKILFLILFKYNLLNRHYEKLNKINANNNLIEDLILKEINFAKGNEISLTPNEQRLLLKITIYSFFFKSILQSRPIIAFIGPKGSGKSHICRAIGKILIGPKFDVKAGHLSTFDSFHNPIISY